MAPDPRSVPYRQTREYVESLVKAAIQRAQVRHHVHEIESEHTDAPALLDAPWLHLAH